MAEDDEVRTEEHSHAPSLEHPHGSPDTPKLGKDASKKQKKLAYISVVLGIVGLIVMYIFYRKSQSSATSSPASVLPPSSTGTSTTVPSGTGGAGSGGGGYGAQNNALLSQLLSALQAPQPGSTTTSSTPPMTTSSTPPTTTSSTPPTTSPGNATQGPPVTVPGASQGYGWTTSNGQRVWGKLPAYVPATTTHSYGTSSPYTSQQVAQNSPGPSELSTQAQNNAAWAKAYSAPASSTGAGMAATQTGGTTTAAKHTVRTSVGHNYLRP